MSYLNQILNQIKQKRFYFIVMILFWCYVLFLNNPIDPGKGTNIARAFGAERTGTTGRIVTDTEVKQKIKVDVDNAESVQLCFGTYNKVSKGTVYITIKDLTSDTVLYNDTVYCSSFKDNQYYKISFPRQTESKGKIYEVTIKGAFLPLEESVTLLNSNVLGEGSYQAQVNGIDSGFVLNYKLEYVDNSMQIVKILFWIFIILLSFAMVYFIDGTDEKNFLKLAFILGIWVVFLNPFFHNLDESTHFFRSFAISQGEFIDTINENGKIGAEISSNYSTIVSAKLSPSSYFMDSSIWQQKFSKETSFYVNPYMSSVTPVNHSVAAIGIFIGNLLGMNAVGVIILGRLFDYLFYVLLCYWAIKNMKYYKTLIFTVALLPMSVWLAASYSIDPILIASSLLFASICFKYFFEKNEDTKVSIMDMVLLLLCGLFISSVKYLVYTPILLLFFLIPWKKFGKKNYIIMLSSAFLIVIAMAVFQIYLLSAIPFTEDRNGDVDVVRQIQFMLDSPKYTLRNFGKYFIDSITSHLSGFHYNSAVPMIGYLMGFFAVFGAVCEKSKYKFESLKTKRTVVILCLSIAVVVFALTIASLYAGFTPVGKFDVEGLQTRYLVPILLMVMIPISCINVDNKIRNYERKVGFFLGIGLVNMMAGILLSVFA